MKKFVLGVAVVASLTLLSACSADGAGDTAQTAVAVATDAASQAPVGASGESTVLLGSVGSADRGVDHADRRSSIRSHRPTGRISSSEVPEDWLPERRWLRRTASRS